MQIRSTRYSTLPIEHTVSSPQQVQRQPLTQDAIATDTVRAGQVARRLGITPLMVDQLRQNRRLLAVSYAHGFAYPSWQFEGRGLLSGFPTVLGALQGHDPAAQLAFFLTPHAGLGGRTPLDALQAGELEAVLQLIRS